MIKEIRRQLAGLGDPRDAEFLQRYFKTGPGQYGEGDLFRGIRVPAVRKVCRVWRELPMEIVGELLESPYHEDRLLSLFILVYRYEKGDSSRRSTIYRLYLDSTRYINNWDLVDCSAGRIVGAQLNEASREPLYRLARSESLWERRIAIMATSFFIGHHDFGDTLRIAEQLLADREDLIHKAVGWMLREVGKRDFQCAESFLLAHYQRMPRTMLRYAIERFPAEKRLAYLKGTAA